MGGEDTLLRDHFHVLRIDGASACLPRLFIQEFQRKKSGMPLETPDILMTEGVEHSYATDAENHFLAEPEKSSPP